MPSVDTILLLTRHCPFDIHDGSGAYVGSIIDYLVQSNLNVAVAWSSPEFFLEDPREIFQSQLTHASVRVLLRGYEEFQAGQFKKRAPQPRLQPSGPAHPLARLRKWLRKWKKRQGLGSTRQSQWLAPPQGSELRFFQSAIDDIRPRHLIFNYSWIAAAVPHLRISEDTQTFVLTHDVWHQRFKGHHPESKRALNRRLEVNYLRSADIIISISSEDKATFMNLLPDKRHLYLPKPISNIACSSSPPNGPILFVGSRNEANLSAIIWFLDHCWPIVTGKCPQAALLVAGSIGTSLDGLPAGAKALGHVPNLAEVYQQASLCVVPLLFGSGMKIKLVEAAAHGRTVVSTSIGMQGLNFLGPAVFQADEPGRFANLVIQLLDDVPLRHRMETEAHSIIQANLNPAQAMKELMDALHARSWASTTKN